jgi:hypothetical protein
MAGIDCAGFVAAATGAYHIGLWNGNSCFKPNGSTILGHSHKYSPTLGGTTTTPSYSAWSGVQPMDVFVWPGEHILFYSIRRKDGAGFDTMEATTSGNPQGAKTYTRTFAHLQNYTWGTWWGRQQGDDFGLAYPLANPMTHTRIKGYNTYYVYTVTSTKPYVRITVNAQNGDPDLNVFNDSYTLLTHPQQVGSDTARVSNPGVGRKIYVQVPAFTDTTYLVSATEEDNSGTTVPASPTGLSATAASASQINLYWNDNSNNETGFKIERKIAILILEHTILSYSTS